MPKDGKYIYCLDEVGKAILIGLYKYGRGKTIEESLTDAKIQCDNSRQVEAAISLEALELIHSVSYQLPLEIHAELTPLGYALAKAMLKPKKSKVKTFIVNASRRFGTDYDFSFPA
jgi:hypothetical protein